VGGSCVGVGGPGPHPPTPKPQNPNPQSPSNKYISKNTLLKIIL